MAQNAGLKTLNELQEDRTPAMNKINLFITNSANDIALGIPVSVLAVGLIKHDKQDIKKGLYIAETYAVSSAITLALKYSIKRSRPYHNDPGLIPLSVEGSYSFPSGHTSAAFASATSLSLSYPKWYVIAPAALWASSVAYSRMYLGVHYPSDVLGGAIVGAGSAFLTKKINDWLHAKHQAHENQKLLN
jgi:membrane-associated phospholipid phosphatase